MEFASVYDDLVVTDAVSDVSHVADRESDDEVEEEDVNPQPNKKEDLNALRV